jgi:6-phosphogluconolactonase (cycloisomerase 2 family)
MYSINTATGTLAALSGSPLSTGSSPESLAIDPAGRFLYAANVTGANEVTSFSITPSNGMLTAVSSVGSGTFPLNIVVDPAGQFAYAANQNSNNVSVYSINATTGALTQVPGSPFAAGVNPRGVALD